VSGPLTPERVVKLSHLVARRMVDEESARDIAQDTWIKYCTQVEREGDAWEPARARSWVLAVAGNAARSQLRKGRRRPVEAFEPEVHASPQEGPVEQVLHTEEQALAHELAWKILSELPREKRLLLVLRELEALSWDQVAQLMGEKPHTLRARHSRLKTQLRERLAKLDPIESPSPDSERSGPEPTRPRELPRETGQREVGHA
jgi:RNA polymerase sigma-70 factor, ECF subfamily